MKIAVNSRSQVGSDHRLERLLAGALNPPHAAEVSDQSIAGLWAYTRNRKQVRFAIPNLAAFAVVGDRESVRFIADPLH